MAIRYSSKGDFSKTYKFLDNVQKFKPEKVLKRYAEQGVAALKAATPIDSGATASSWGYKIESKGDKNVTISWTNSNRNNGVSIAVILQYGHGTRTGGYVQGRDYINPAMKPIFDKIAKDAWEEVKSL